MLLQTKRVRELAIMLSFSIVGGLLAGLLLENLIYGLLALVAIFALVWATSFVINMLYAPRKLGIIRVYPNREASEKALRAYLRGANEVKILAIRGLHIAGSDHSILYKEIKATPPNYWPKKIRILLLNPDSPYIEQRAREVNLSPEQYRNQCLETRKFLDNIMKGQFKLDISWANYDSKYLWTFTLCDNRGFFSYYTAAKEGPQLPQYEIIAGPGTIFEAFSKLFEQLWPAGQ